MSARRMSGACSILSRLKRTRIFRRPRSAEPTRLGARRRAHLAPTIYRSTGQPVNRTMSIGFEGEQALVEIGQQQQLVNIACRLPAQRAFCASGAELKSWWI